MIMLLDDHSPLVRRALAEALASDENAPRVVVHALAADQPDVALPVLTYSPLLLEDDLVDLIATRQSDVQVAIASRPYVPRSLAAAIAEVAGPEACLALLENPDADIAPFSLDRIIDRFGRRVRVVVVVVASGHGGGNGRREASLGRTPAPAKRRLLRAMLLPFASARLSSLRIDDYPIQGSTSLLLWKERSACSRVE